MATPTKVTIETTAEGLDPGESVTVEFTYDPDEVELLLIPAPAPYVDRWRAIASALSDMVRPRRNA